jgi:hypothetical protein
MPHRGTTLNLVPWVGGLDLVTEPTMADPQTLHQAENIELQFDGTRTKRGGTRLFNQSPLIDTED